MLAPPNDFDVDSIIVNGDSNKWLAVDDSSLELLGEARTLEQSVELRSLLLAVQLGVASVLMSSVFELVIVGAVLSNNRFCAFQASGVTVAVVQRREHGNV